MEFSGFFFNMSTFHLNCVCVCVYACVCVCVCVISHVWLFEILWTIACQDPQSMEFSRQEFWSGLPFPNPKGSSWPSNQVRISWVSWICKQVNSLPLHFMRTPNNNVCPSTKYLNCKTLSFFLILSVVLDFSWTNNLRILKHIIS